MPKHTVFWEEFKCAQMLGLLCFEEISDASSQLQEVIHMRWVWKQMWAYFPVFDLVDSSQKANPKLES